MSSGSDDERRWQAFADEARAMLETMTDPEARRFMYHIMIGYIRLAEHARKREQSGKPNNGDVPE